MIHFVNTSAIPTMGSVPWLDRTTVQTNVDHFSRFHIYLFFFYYYYLAASGLSCSTRDLCCLMWDLSFWYTDSRCGAQA